VLEVGKAFSYHFLQPLL